MERRVTVAAAIAALLASVGVEFSGVLENVGAVFGGTLESAGAGFGCAAVVSLAIAEAGFSDTAFATFVNAEAGFSGGADVFSTVRAEGAGAGFTDGAPTAFFVWYEAEFCGECKESFCAECRKQFREYRARIGAGRPFIEFSVGKIFRVFIPKFYAEKGRVSTFSACAAHIKEKKFSDAPYIKKFLRAAR